MLTRCEIHLRHAERDRAAPTGGAHAAPPMRTTALPRIWPALRDEWDEAARDISAQLPADRFPHLAAFTAEHVLADPGTADDDDRSAPVQVATDRGVAGRCHRQ